MEEKMRMDRLLEVFGDYIAASPDIDVAWAEKTGYVRLIVAECADWVYFPIKNFDDMLGMFFFDILCDEVNQTMEQNPKLTNRTMDYSVPYERLLKYVDALGPDRDHAAAELEKFIEFWKNQELLP